LVKDSKFVNLRVKWRLKARTDDRHTISAHLRVTRTRSGANDPPFTVDVASPHPSASVVPPEKTIPALDSALQQRNTPFFASNHFWDR
jgi:hypothetical protein